MATRARAGGAVRPCTLEESGSRPGRGSFVYGWPNGEAEQKKRTKRQSAFADGTEFARLLRNKENGRRRRIAQAGASGSVCFDVQGRPAS
jgi:hypothetical protein